ncbi:sugar ABC transporter substrate-binding protein [Microbacterium mangrovi]|uniref:Sugar ABC transporter substrate-binding protein n=1 Tax=Microbacterium mangrovi TaxID=1348253 RepID=A0A0B1ZX48_9MICO|nr:ABC transporter substrate-binding protein [Microbacterium mangrovi]KHK95755.1 sugar ABC transporter substrate-binding protein [Microbacterium mangrovi]
MFTKKRLLAVAAFAAASAIALAGCSSGGPNGGTAASAAPTHLSGTVSLWHFFTDREAAVIQSVVDDFQKKNPDVKVVVHSGQDDTKLTTAIASGQPVDVGISYSTDIVGKFCSSGAFIDLAPYIKRDKVDMGQFSKVVKSYTEFKGVRCTMPALADAYGLYYNKDILQKFGYSAPPKTLTELETMAMKMTTYNADGSIKTLGFNPLMGWAENAAAHYGPSAGAQWLNAQGQAVISQDPGWKELMTWQKGFVDKIGYDKLNKFTAGLGQEFGATNAFQTGQVAMNLDGEWRTAFIKAQKPGLNYGTAPFPTTDSHTDLYGGGYLTGNIAGIGKGSQNKELAWALLKYLTTDTAAVVKLANGLGNVPTTKDALASPALNLPPQFGTFLQVMASPHSDTTPPSPVGAGYQQTFNDYWTKYQSGQGGDLAAGLQQVDKTINASINLATGP